MSATASRRVQVQTLSARAELLAVVRASMSIVVGVWIYVAMMAGVGGNAPRQRNLLPFQKLIADRVPAEQRMFRELQEGLLEAEAARATANAWPTPDSLAAAGIPPFARDPTQRSSYQWQLEQGGTTVNYVGVPTTAGLPAWLLLVTEPTPGVPPDQTFEDEEHHRLPDGGMLHVSTWVHADGGAIAPRLVRMPQAEGWTQLYAVGPARAATRR
ncbi:MAG TPA: DUF6162 family protein [Vicinamibacterales bacterium]|nr:DUF6162 family protein [Vicinamibacterales bacterium]